MPLAVMLLCQGSPVMEVFLFPPLTLKTLNHPHSGQLLPEHPLGSQEKNNPLSGIGCALLWCPRSCHPTGGEISL